MMKHKYVYIQLYCLLLFYLLLPLLIFAWFTLFMRSSLTYETILDAGGFDALGGVLQPTNSNGEKTNNGPQNLNGNGLNNNNNQQTTNGLLTGDLESSLASLAENLTINNRTAPK